MPDDILLRNSKTRIVIVDSHLFALIGLRALIEQADDIDVCGVAVNRRDAFDRVATDTPDMVITELALTDTNALDLLSSIRKRHPRIKTIVVSRLPEKVYAARAFRAGAMGYVMKHEPPPLILAAVRTVQQGEIHMSDAVKQQIFRKMMPQTMNMNRVAEPLDRLADQELTLFELIGNGYDLVRSAQIMGVCEATAAQCRKRLRRKMGVSHMHVLYTLARQWREQNGW
jgi:DNA-binding NarL/FixJ family response regulator